MRVCTKCERKVTVEELQPRTDGSGGTYTYCRDCYNRQRRERAALRRQGLVAPPETVGRPETPDPEIEAYQRELKARLESDTAPLRYEDFDVGVGNDGRIDPKAAKEKRQEFSKAMGEYAGKLRANELNERDGHYIGGLAEQERRFQNRRMARTVSLAAAQEALNMRLFKAAAEEYLSGKITPTGYAARPKARAVRRTAVLFLSDLHLGSDMGAQDNPLPFGAWEEARRLEYIVRETLDFKPQYREQTELLLLLGGDLIEGSLGHDLRDGAPLTEQKVIFWRHFRTIIGLFAQQFPKVRVVCQPGNHGRDKVRHPGRATSSKWDGHEWQMYYALSMMASDLPNVSFEIPFRAVSIIDLHGSNLLLTHGDTEVKLGDPDTQASRNMTVLDRINSTRIYGVDFQAAAFGHFHKPRYQPRNPKTIFNGALVPPNGYARSEAYIGEPCGQFLWEAVEGFPVGDVRFLEVGPSQDRDERLGQLIKPFRFDL